MSLGEIIVLLETIIRTENTGVSKHLLSSLHATTSPTRLVVRQERSGQRSVESLPLNIMLELSPPCSSTPPSARGILLFFILVQN